MEICGSIHANLRAALQSARRLRNGPVHPDTVDHWSRIVAVARADEGDVRFTTRELVCDLEREIRAREARPRGGC
jgi:hypothetical protein